MHLLSEEVKQESICFAPLKQLAPEVIATIGKVIPPVKNIYQSMQQWFDHLELENELIKKNTPEPYSLK